MPASPALTAAYDQARADGNEKLDLVLGSIARHTDGMSPVNTAVTVSLVLEGMDEAFLRDLLQAALIRITEAGIVPPPDTTPRTGEPS